MSRVLFVLTVAVLAAALWLGEPVPAQGQAPTATPGPWPMFQHDPRHTGRSQYQGPSRVTHAWSYNTNNGPLVGSPIVAADGTIYVGSGGYLYAFNSSGAALWRLPVGTTFGSLLLTDASTIYVTGTMGTDVWLRLVAPDGSVLLSDSFPGAAFLEPQTLAVAPDGTIYLGVSTTTGTGVLHALTPDPATGGFTTRWSLTVGFFGGSQPAIAPNGTIYVGTYEPSGALWAISPLGAVIWRTEALGFVSSSPSVESNGETIYVGASTGLYAVNANGLVRWVMRTSQPVNYSSPSIDIDGTIYIGAGDALHAVDPLGNLRWRSVCLPGSLVNSSPAVSADGGIFFQVIQPGGTPSAALCAADATGTIRWAAYTQHTGQNGPIAPSPAIGSNGTIYVGAPDGVVIALAPVSYGTERRVRIPLILR